MVRRKRENDWTTFSAPDFHAPQMVTPDFRRVVKNFDPKHTKDTFKSDPPVRIKLNPNVHSGWKSTQSPAVRRRHLITSTDKRQAMRDRLRTAGRRAQAIGILNSRSPEVKAAAISDSHYFFARIKKMKK